MQQIAPQRSLTATTFLSNSAPLSYQHLISPQRSEPVEVPHETRPQDSNRFGISRRWSFRLHVVSVRPVPTVLLTAFTSGRRSHEISKR
ncbi:hypothetical protein Mapa_011592 [Marchantia paleacea]|nr:hypothetical protein Mapa_011592 [Marchantia paleacea]